MTRAPRPTALGPFSVEQAAAYLNVSPRFIRRLVSERRIPHLKIGRLVRIRPDDLEAYAELCLRPATQPTS